MARCNIPGRDPLSQAVSNAAAVYDNVGAEPYVREAALKLLTSLKNPASLEVLEQQLADLGFPAAASAGVIQKLRESVGPTAQRDLAKVLLENFDETWTGAPLNEERAAAADAKLGTFQLTNEEYRGMRSNAHRKAHWQKLLNEAGTLKELSEGFERYSPAVLGTNDAETLRTNMVEKFGGGAAVASRINEEFASLGKLPRLAHWIAQKDSIEMWEDLSPQVKGELRKMENIHVTDASMDLLEDNPPIAQDAFKRMRTTANQASQILASLLNGWVGSPMYVLGEVGGTPLEELASTVARTAYGKISEGMQNADNALAELDAEVRDVLEFLDLNPNADIRMWRAADGRIPISELPEQQRPHATKIRGVFKRLMDQQKDAILQSKISEEESLAGIVLTHQAALAVPGVTPAQRRQIERSLAPILRLRAQVQSDIINMPNLERNNYVTWLHRALDFDIRHTQGAWIGNPNVRQKYLESRTGSEEDVQQSLLLSLAAYLPYAARKIHTEPRLFEAKRIIDDMDPDSVPAKMGRILIDMISAPGQTPTGQMFENIGNQLAKAQEDPSSFDPSALTKVIDAVAGRVYPGFIDFFDTPLLNITQLINSASLLAGTMTDDPDAGILKRAGTAVFRPAIVDARIAAGLTWASWRGMKNIYSKITGKPDTDLEEKIAGVINHSNSVFGADVITHIRKRFNQSEADSVIGSIIRMSDNVILAPMRATEYLNRMTTFGTFSDYLVAKGMPRFEADEVGALMSNATQFRTDALGSNPALQGPYARALFPLAKFSLRQFEFVARNVISPMSEAGGGGVGGFVDALIPRATPRYREIWGDPLHRQARRAAYTWAVNTGATATILKGLGFSNIWMSLLFGAIPGAILGPLATTFMDLVGGATRGDEDKFWRALESASRLLPGGQRALHQPRTTLGDRSVAGVAGELAQDAVRPQQFPGQLPPQRPTVSVGEGGATVPTPNGNIDERLKALEPK